MSYGAKNYKQQQIQTATPAQLLILLYEGAILNVKKASAAIDSGNLSDKGLYIGKTHDIINELNTSLNHEVGGDIAKELERLYNFMVTQLLKANIENSKEPLVAVQKNLETLLAGWKVAVSDYQRQAAARKA